MRTRKSVCLFISLIIVSLLAGVIGYQVIFAANEDANTIYSSCMQSSGAPLTTAYNACYPCATQAHQGTVGYSIAWVGPDGKVDSNIIVTSPTDTSAKGVFHMKNYTCRYSSPLNFHSSYYVWFGPLGEERDQSQALDWLVFSNPASSKVVPFAPSPLHFSWTGVGSADVTISVPSLKAYIDSGAPGITVLSSDGDTTTYEIDYNVNSCNDNFGISGYDYGILTHPTANGGRFSCAGMPSTITVTIGDNIPDPDTGGVTVYYESQSGVDVKGGVDMSSLPSGTLVDGSFIQTDIDGDKNVEFSIDSGTDSHTVTFRHRIDYRPNGFAMGTKDQWTTSDSAGDEKAGSGIDDVADGDHMFTAYTITNSGDGSTPASGKTPVTHSTTDKDTGSGYEMSYNYTFSNLQPGVPQTACSTISYDDKNHEVKYKKHIVKHKQNAQAAGGYDQDGNEKEDGPYDADGNYHPAQEAADEDSHLDWYWSSSSDSEDSKVCVTVVRPKEPGGQPENPDLSGKSRANVMFAGEDTSLKWNIWAEGVASHRLQERQAIGYFVSATTGYSSAIHTGNSHTSSDPCGHYNSYAQACKRFSDGDTTWSSDTVSDNDFKDKIIKVKVPNQVGNKYCNSAGYKFQHYYAIDGTWIADSRAGKTYWYIFNASCRTIAKKPTTAIWNGGLFTLGGTSTSIANRFNQIGFGDLTSENNPTPPSPATTTFGSWSEFLATVNGNALNFGSGSVFYNGTTLGSSDYYPLTIANRNKNDPGHSGVTYNQTLLTRLNAFLRNPDSATIANAQYEEHVGDYTIQELHVNSGTMIYSIKGNLTIDGDIMINSNINYHSIYDIPQVIIFADGDVKITSKVSRIDAWIITPNGEINTCAGFVKPNSSTGEHGTQTDYSDHYDPALGCNRQLVFNGPVIANRLVLNRSFGADIYAQTGFGSMGMLSDRQAPAEIFNFRADSYLWAYAQSSRYDSSFTESYSRELAPRY